MNKLNNTQSINLEFYFVVDVVVVNVVVIIVVVRIFFSALISFDFNSHIFCLFSSVAVWLLDVIFFAACSRNIRRAISNADTTPVLASQWINKMQTIDKCQCQPGR